MYKNLYRGGVQVDGSGARNEVKKLGNLGVESGCLDRFHGGDGEVKRGVSLNLLNKATHESCINIITDFLIGWN